MPPSGFTQSHSRGISDFFSSCLADLIHEAQLAGLSPVQALNREIRNIKADFLKHNRSPSATATLCLILAYYEKVMEMGDRLSNFDHLRAAGVAASNEIVREIEAIRVEEPVTA
jgi:hypothetical protein